MVIPFKVLILGHTHSIAAWIHPSLWHHLKNDDYSSLEGGLAFWRKHRGTPAEMGEGRGGQQGLVGSRQVGFLVQPASPPPTVF